jgi:CheY-like chemotaxis protein
VLVVDDVPTNRRIIVDLLEPLGFDISEAVDGEDGVRATVSRRPDLVLMDIRMPVLDGRAAVRRLRATPEVAGLPVVAMSASVSMIELNETIAAGFDAFLPKPVLWPQLADTLRTFLQIEWVDAPSNGTPSSDEAALPPTEVLEPLMEMALLGDLSALAERTDRLEALHASYAPFAERLRELAEGFEEQAVLSLLKRAMNAPEQTA